MMLCIAQRLPVARCGGMSLPGARLSGLRDDLLPGCRASRRPGREARHRRRLCGPAVLVWPPTRATLLTQNAVSTTLLHKIYSEKTSSGGKLQMLEFRINLIINKCQSFMIHNSEIYYKPFQLRWNWGHTCCFCCTCWSRITSESKSEVINQVKWTIWEGLPSVKGQIKKKEAKIWEDTKKMCKISLKNKECF